MTVSDTMDVLGLLDGACAWTRNKIAGTSRDQWGLPTPCDAWDVRELIDHVIVSGHLFALIARGEFESVESFFKTRPERFADDPVGPYEASTKELLEAFRAPGGLERVVLSTWGKGSVADQAVRIAVGHLAHGWDLSTATGQDTRIPPELARAALANVDGMIPDAARGAEGKPYKLVVPTDPSASAEDKLIAYLGRQPS
jgi:uncharacterized protein (TIGR03086 family)